MRIHLSHCLTAGCVMLFGACLVAAETHEGKVVSTQDARDNGDGKLVMTDKDNNKEHSHTISSQVRITRESKAVKLSDLHKGDRIKVTTNDDGKVTEVAALDSKTDPSDSQSKDQGSRDRDSSNANSKGQSDLPDFLANLNLTEDQKNKLKSVCHECDSERESAWRQFGQKYRETIQIEASMLAAIEENLTEHQKKLINNQRDRSVRGHWGHDRKGSGHDRKSSDNNDQDKTSKSNDQDKNGATATSSKDSQNSSDKPQNDQHQNKPGAVPGTGAGPDVIEEITVIGVTLSPEQENAAEGIRNSYFHRLRRLNAELSHLHSRLVALETNRLLKIEDILTKEQRTQLRRDHQKLEGFGHRAPEGSDRANSNNSN